MNKFLIAILALTSMSTFAEDRSGPYIGIGGGIVDFHENNVDADGWSTQVFVGYSFNPYLSVEIAAEQQSLDDGITVSYEDYPDDDTVNISGSANAISISILPTLPLSNKVDAFASFGYEYSTYTGYAQQLTSGDYELSYSEDNQLAFSDSSSNFIVGAGIAFHATDSVFIRGRWNTSVNDFGDTDHFGIDVGINF